MKTKARNIRIKKLVDNINYSKLSKVLCKACDGTGLNSKGFNCSPCKGTGVKQ